MSKHINLQHLVSYCPAIGLENYQMAREGFIEQVGTEDDMISVIRDSSWVLEEDDE